MKAPLLVASELHRDQAPRLSELDRVIDEMVDHEPEAVFVEPHARHPIVRGELQSKTFRLGARPHRSDPALDEGKERDVDGPKLKQSLLELRHVDDVLNGAK